MPRHPNAVREAVTAIGGPTQTANILGVSGAAVHFWIKRKRLTDRDKALILAHRSGIALARLLKSA